MIPPYLTYKEYKKLSTEPIEEEVFDTHLKIASDVLDYETLNHYQYFKLKDNYPGKQFKKALARQIDYQVANSITSSQDAVDGEVNSVHLGSFSYSTNGDKGSAKVSNSNPMLCREAYNLLAYTGLLYRGVDTL